MIYFTLCGLMLCCFSITLHGMKPEKSGPCTLSPDIVVNVVQPFLSYEDLGRLQRVSKRTQPLWNFEKMCTNRGSGCCGSYACSRLLNNYYACTKALVHCAQSNNKEQFGHLWSLHSFVRAKFDSANRNLQMHNYKKKMSKKEDLARAHIRHLADVIEEKDVFAATTILSKGSPAPLDLVQVYAPQCEPVFIDLQLRDLFYNAFELNSLEIVIDLCGGQVDGRSLSYIMRYGDCRMIKALFRAEKMSVDIVDQFRKRPLHYAAEFGMHGLAIMFLNKGAYPNSRDNKGRTPLHYAAKKAHVRVVKTLLEQNDVSILCTNKNGRTPLRYVSKWRISCAKSAEKTDDMRRIRAMLKDARDK